MTKAEQREAAEVLRRVVEFPRLAIKAAIQKRVHAQAPEVAIGHCR